MSKTGWKLAKGKTWRMKLEQQHPHHGKTMPKPISGMAEGAWESICIKHARAYGLGMRPVLASVAVGETTIVCKMPQRTIGQLSPASTSYFVFSSSCRKLGTTDIMDWPRSEKKDLGQPASVQFANGLRS